MTYVLFVSLVVGATAAAVVLRALARQRRRHRSLRWVVPYLLDAPRRRLPRPGEDVHLLLCVADHFEPRANGASADVARARVATWLETFPRQFGGFRDSDGRPPRHTFFYPMEEYDREHLDALTALCAAGFAEVEIHLHHESMGGAQLRRVLEEARDTLYHRHGLLARHRQTGRLAYGFIHGNWALNNARADGRWCGVNDELGILRATGCYADFTMPSAPDATQTRTLNRIYYADANRHCPRAHDHGTPIGAGTPPAHALLLIQGPLVLDWRRPKWGLGPRLENGCLQDSQPPGIDRLAMWLRARVQVPARPDWFFVKLHAHGALPDSQAALLGGPMVRFHEALRRHAEAHPRFHYHYVSAREMYNLARAAEAGWRSSVAEARDYELLPNRAAAVAGSGAATPEILQGPQAGYGTC